MYINRLALALLAVLSIMSVDARKSYDSYKGLVMAGYQGWFNTPEDGENRGYYHYKGRDGFKPGSASVDMWTDVREIPVTYATEFKMENGTPARVFSSADASTVDTHFKWMQEYGLDGVFMQRFVGEIKRESGRNHFNGVLNNAIKSAHKYERAIAVMYDLSGMRPGDQKVVLADADSLARVYDLKNHEKCPSYLYHNGKPLIAVWGVGFNDGRRYTIKDAEDIVDGLKAHGFSVMLGVPTHWRDLRHDTTKDPALHALIKKCDVVMPWFVGRYGERSYPEYKPLIKKDIEWCKKNNVDYAPLCFPGFTWDNMKGAGSHKTPRNNGSFFWKQLRGALELGAEMIYVAMFDEIDEGTAVFKVSEEVPVPAPGSVFVPIDKGLGSDYYLRMIGEASKAIKEGRQLDARQPLTERERAAKK